MAKDVNINEVIADAQVAFNVKFEEGRARYEPVHTKLASEVESNSAASAYGMLEDFPSIKEWLTDRQLKELETYDYIIKNRTFESSIQIKREEFEDNDYGKYSMIFDQFGYKAEAFPDDLMFTAMKEGHLKACIDGQYFFDTDHPNGKNIEGVPQVYSNLYGTKSTETLKPRWYLFDGRQGLKPFIYQKRRPFKVTAITGDTTGEVFINNRVLFGVDGRLNMGYGMWQCGAASWDDLNETSFNEVYDGMLSVKGSSGDSLKIVPSVIVVPVSLRVAAEKLFLRQQLANGDDNPNYKRVEIVVSAEL
ncbi:Mu-like prophage major head subunit gpT family protein [Salmonella enterica]|nr:Mu-like prophage major head subunit gpT family protein [Salmonella enterica]